MGGYKCQLSVKILAICQLSVKFWAIYQRCRLLDRYHTHILARGVASCFWSVCFPDIKR